MVRTAVTPGTEPAALDRQFPDITEMEEAFVWALLANSGKMKAAAITAGYAKTSAHVTASRISRKPAVLRAIREAGAMSLAHLVPQSIGAIAKLGLRANSEHVRLEASKDILDRVGMAAPKQVRLGGQLSVVFDLT